MATQSDIATALLNQLRVIDPTVSGDIGTPERKIIDAFSQGLANAQLNISTLQGSLDINSKVGNSLTQFLSIFGFARQAATSATGIVTFSLVSSINSDTTISNGTQVAANITDSSGNTSTTIFQTQYAATIAASTTSIDVPIQAVLAGSTGDVAANTITSFVGNPVYGGVSVNNSQATTNGSDQETDDELKIRFANGPFRNLAGTIDQYLALAAADPNVTKANVIGPISRFSEYLQVPPVDDDSSYVIDTFSLDGNGGGARAGFYTSALSSIPYSQYVYADAPAFVSNGQVGVNTIFYRRGIDWDMNTLLTQKDFGDTYRFHQSVLVPPPGVDPVDAPFQPNVTFYNTLFTTTLAASTLPGVSVFQVLTPGLQVGQTFTIDNDVLTVTSLSSSMGNYFVDFTPPATQAHTGALDGSGAVISIQGAEGILPGSTVLFEHAYCSRASRNIVSNNITNAVDVFIDGTNPTSAITTIPIPNSGGVFPSTFSIVTNSPYYYANFFRQGTITNPRCNTVLGSSYSNVFFPLFAQPAMSIPDQLQINGTVSGTPTTVFYLEGINYWLVQEISDIYGTVRARNGIEWDITTNGWITNPGVGSATGNPLNDFDVGSTITVTGYTYDKNITDLQATMEAAKQTTTDVLVHQSRTRYFKIDITVVYSQSVSSSQVNSSIQSSVSSYLSGQYFGGLIELSQLLQAVDNVSGVQNVRWSANILGPALGGAVAEACVYETDVNGNVLNGTPDFGDTYTNRFGEIVSSLISEDFYLQDDELPSLPTGQVAGDTLPGLVIRVRAQNTFLRG